MICAGTKQNEEMIIQFGGERWSAFILLSNIPKRVTSHGILQYLLSEDLLINLLMLLSIDYVNIYLFPIYFSID